MRKELIWAGIIGISFGVVIAFGIYRINLSFNKDKRTELKQKINLTNTVSSEFKIALDKPENNDVVTTGTITVSGITKPLVWVTLSGESGDYTIQSGTDGIFVQDVDLISGINQIKITAFDKEGNQSLEKVLVVYSSAFKTKTASVETATEASSESAIRAKVQEKVAEALNRPKAYIGVVTDIADSTIQIKTDKAEIKQISVSAPDIAVVDTVPTVKNVKLTDIAIGDFIVAMGYINSSSVLIAQRILITDPITEPKISATFGKLSDIDKKITITKAIKLKLAKIKADDQIVFVTTVDDKGASTIRSIFVITKS